MDDGPFRLVTEAERTLLVLMAREDRELFGAVRRTSDGRRWRIDVRPYGWIHGLAGVSFGDQREMAEAVLNVIRVKIAQGTPREDAVAEFLPMVSDAYRIRHRHEAWLAHMDGLVGSGGGTRQPSDLGVADQPPDRPKHRLGQWWRPRAGCQPAAQCRRGAGVLLAPARSPPQE